MDDLGIEVSKPSDWPANQKECALENIYDSVVKFIDNPGYETKEVLVSLVSDYDLNQRSYLGLHRTTDYEVAMINALYMHAGMINLNTLKVYLYEIVGEATRKQKMISQMIEDYSQSLEIEQYQYLMPSLKLYHVAYQHFTVLKNRNLADQIIDVVNQVLLTNTSEETVFNLTHAYVTMLNDISYFRSKKRTGIWAFSREDLSKLFSLEAKLVKMNNESATVRPLKRVLMTTISNYILKSRNNYNADYICKYISKEVAESSTQNREIWMQKIKYLNDKRELKVMPELFANKQWLDYSWAKNIDFTPTREYYVSSFSKTIKNDDMNGRYGQCVYGYKDERIAELLAPIWLRKGRNNKQMPFFSQVVAYDVIYDAQDAKQEINYLCTMIDKFELKPEEYLKWICGFANAQGGILYIGKDDKGRTVGIKDSKKLLEDIPNKVRDILGILVDVDLLNENDKDYIRITVNPHSYPVNYKGEYHYRSGSTKQILKGAVLTEFLTAKTGRNWDDIPIERVTVKELDEESFNIFRSQALKSGRMDEKDLKMSNEQLVDSLGLLEERKLTRAAILLFHKNPEKWIKGSYIKIGFFETDAELRYQDEIHGSLLQQAEKVIDLLFTKYLKAEISYVGVTRVEKYPFPKAGIREAIYNAIIHKNYASQIPIQISVYEDKLYIANDCIFPAGWTVETLLQKHRSKPYNPNVANGFFRAGFVETWGRGIEKICEACKRYEIENPEYTLYPEDIMVQFKSKKMLTVRDSVKKSEPRMTEVLTEREEKRMAPLLEYLKEHEQIDNSTGRELTGKSAATVKRYLRRLSEVGLLEGEGSTSNKVYNRVATFWQQKISKSK